MMQDEVRRALAAKLRDVGDDDGMAEPWDLGRALSDCGVFEAGRANAALLADLVDCPVCENVAEFSGLDFECGACGYSRDLAAGYAYCPRCGAKVVEEVLPPEMPKPEPKPKFLDADGVEIRVGDVLYAAPPLGTGRGSAWKVKAIVEIRGEFSIQ